MADVSFPGRLGARKMMGPAADGCAKPGND